MSLTKRLCPACGLNLDLVGERHNCRGNLARSAGLAEASARATPHIRAKVAPVSHAAVSHAQPEQGNADVRRVRRWRSYHAAYMRTWRKRRKAGQASAIHTQRRITG